MKSQEASGPNLRMMADVLRLGTTEWPLGETTYVMGVINVSPDSKNTHTVATTLEEAVLMANRYREWGASLIDLGGQSSHYDNPTIAAADEISRVVPVIGALTSEGHLVAIDTWKPEVAVEAVAAGAVVVNDTGGLADPEMRKIVAGNDVAAIAVHVEGANPHDVDEIEIRADKSRQAAKQFRVLLSDLEAVGISNLIIDPGIALNYRGDYQAYTAMQLQVIADASEFRSLGKPILIPIPRKRDGHRVAAYISLALEHRADIIRVHDVAMACDLARLFGRSL